MKGLADLRLGITREQSRLSSLIEQASARGVEICPLPLTRILPIPFELPDNLSLDSLDWLIFSSGNGVRIFFQRLLGLGESVSDSTKIAVTGQKTAEALKAASGRVADFLPSESYGEVLFKELAERNDLAGVKIGHARAEQIIFDPTDFLKNQQADYWPFICYRSETRVVDQEILAQFDQDDYLLFTSPSAVTSFVSQASRPVSKLMAMGKSTAAAMREAGWTKLKILEAQDIDRILECI